MKRIGACGFALAILLSPIRVAYAQSVDYGALEGLFDEPVTLTATGKPQKSSESPVALQIITADQIRRMGVQSLPEVLNKLNGVGTWQSSRSFADLGIRGRNRPYNPSILVLLNGRQVYQDGYGFTDWNVLPVELEEIRQIEVVKAPTTALYGFNAAAGVVNIITYSPKYDDKNQAGLVGGTGRYGRAYAIKTLKLSDRVSTRISTGAESYDEFDLRSKTTYPHGGPIRKDDRTRRILSDSVIQLSDNTELRLEEGFSDGQGTDNSPVAFPLRDDKYTVSSKASLLSDSSLGLLEFNLYGNVFHDVFDAKPLPGSLNTVLYTAQAQDLFKIGPAHTFRVQAEYRNNAMRSGELIGPDAEIAYDILSAGGMWDWAISSELEWNNAVRLDHVSLFRNGGFIPAMANLSNADYSRTLTEYSVNSGLVWKANALDSFRVSFGRGLELPSLTLFGFGYKDFSAFHINLLGNSRLNATTFKNYELGYDRYVRALKGKFQSAIFYRLIKNINQIALVPQFSATGISLVTGSEGDSSTAGFELSLDGKWSEHWGWDVGYTYQNTIDDFRPDARVVPSIAANHYRNTVPHHTVKAHVGYTTGSWEADLYSEAASGFDTWQSSGLQYFPNSLDGYYSLGGRIGYQFTNDMTLALSGTNLQAARVANNYGLENERQVFVTLSKTF